MLIIMYTTSPRIKAIKAKIITTDDYNLVGKIIIKNAVGLGNIIPKCVHGVQVAENVSKYVKNSMQPGAKASFDVHGCQQDLDYARNIMISAYEQVELIDSAWTQFAQLIAYEQIVNNLRVVQGVIKEIYDMATEAPSIQDTKDALWEFDQVEDPADIEKSGAKLMSSIFDSIHKYYYIINLYGQLAKHPLVNSSYIQGVLNYMANETLRLGVVANQPKRRRFF